MALTGLAAACAIGTVAWPAAAAESYSEDAVKAAFLYRFTGYVDWPVQALADPQFTIAVLGADGRLYNSAAIVDASGTRAVAIYAERFIEAPLGPVPGPHAHAGQSRRRLRRRRRGTRPAGPARWTA